MVDDTELFVLSLRPVEVFDILPDQCDQDKYDHVESSRNPAIRLEEARLNPTSLKYHALAARPSKSSIAMETPFSDPKQDVLGVRACAAVEQSWWVADASTGSIVLINHLCLSTKCQEIHPTCHEEVFLSC